MAFTRTGTVSHDSLSGVSAADHHTATVGGDLNLADLAEKDHASLENVGISDHMNIATVATVEAESAFNEVVIPSRIRNSPGVPKVWVHWEQTGAHGILASYNMTSVTDGGAVGDTDHLWNTDFSVTEYAIIGGAGNTGQPNNLSVNISTQATTGVTTLTINTGDNSAVDDESFLMALGDQ